MVADPSFGEPLPTQITRADQTKPQSSLPKKYAQEHHHGSGPLRRLLCASAWHLSGGTRDSVSFSRGASSDRGAGIQSDSQPS